MTEDAFSDGAGVQSFPALERGTFTAAVGPGRTGALGPVRFHPTRTGADSGQVERQGFRIGPIRTVERCSEHGAFHGIRGHGA